VCVLWPILSETNKYIMFETPTCSEVQHLFSCNLTNLSHVYNLVITLLLLVRATYIYCFSSCTSRSWWITHSTQRHRRGCNTRITPKLATAFRYLIYKHSTFLGHKVIRALLNCNGHNHTQNFVMVIITPKIISNEKEVGYHFYQVILIFWLRQRNGSIYAI